MRSAIKAQQILKALFLNATFAIFQTKKLKRNATYAIAEVAKVALCASNCALPTSGNFGMEYGRCQNGMEWKISRMKWKTIFHTNSILDFVHCIYRKIHTDVGW